MRSKEFNSNTRKLHRLHKSLVNAYYMFLHEVEHSEQYRKSIIKVCKHIVEQFDKSEEEENDRK